MSSSIYYGGRIANTRTTHYLANYDKLRSEYQANPTVASYFFPPPLVVFVKIVQDTIVL